MARPMLGAARWLYQRPGARRLMVELREEFDDRVCAVPGDRPILLHVTSRMEHQRASSVLTKEPDTITWLDQLRSGDLFVDIGANVGVYTLYAAIKRGADVIAFEPEAQNFAALNRNLLTNRVGDRVSAWPLALSDHNGLTRLNLADMTVGGSHHVAGTPIDEWGRPFIPRHVQGSVAMSLDTALESVASGKCPRFVKIDIDGGEEAVLAGMSRVLADRRLEQVLVEMPADATAAPQLHERFEAAGFQYRAPQMTYKGRGNAVFTRHERAESHRDQVDR
jgi:FkbM family methyltransferase